MPLKTVSTVAFVVAVICIAWLGVTAKSLFGTGPVTVAIQIAAFLLMVWARMTFGRRSFHAAANPTEGGLVTTGPYRYLRHPIYAAVCYFLWAGAIAHPAPVCFALVALATVMLGVRMYAEEMLLVQRYPEYADYSRRTRRVLPFVF